MGTETAPPRPEEAAVEEQMRQLAENDLPMSNAEAVEHAAQAAEAESCGLSEIAHEKFFEAARALRELAKATSDPSERAALELQAEEYASRCAHLSTRMSQRNHGDNDFDDSNFLEADIRSGAQLMGTFSGGLMGSIIGIPIIGAGAGFFTASHLVNKETENGARARELGIIGAHVIRTAKSINRNHRVSERAKGAAKDAWKTAKEIDAEHDLRGKAKNMVSGATSSLRRLASR